MKRKKNYTIQNGKKLNEQNHRKVSKGPLHKFPYKWIDTGGQALEILKYYS